MLIHTSKDITLVLSIENVNIKKIFVTCIIKDIAFSSKFG